MSHTWISINPKLTQGVSLINSVERNKFKLMLKHIVYSDNKDIFTPQELSKLTELLKLEESSLQLLIQSTAYIFKQYSKVILKPTVLQEQLVEKLKLDEDKAEDFVKLWTEETKKNFDVENSKSLENISWELNVETASDSCNKQTHVHTRLQMSLENVDGSDKENVVLELDEDELKDLYVVLEKIQSKVDSI